MGARLDELLGRTRFRVVCPECGAVATAKWTLDCGVVRCRSCGSAFPYRDHTYRPVTGGMTDAEREERRLAVHHECDRRRREAIRADPALYAEHLERHRIASRAYIARHRAEHNERNRMYRARLRTEKNRRIMDEWRKTNMGTRNTLGDLTNHLFAQLERLDDEELTPEELEREISRSKAVTGVAEQVISTANTMLRAIQIKDGAMDGKMKIPRMLSDGGE